MQLTRFTDYSLRVLVFLGAHPDRLCTISETAEAYGISANHLMKVVSRLSSVGYIETVRGKGGGMRLSRAPKMINIGDVVRHMEDRFDIVECFNDKAPELPATSCVYAQVSSCRCAPQFHGDTGPPHAAGCPGKWRQRQVRARLRRVNFLATGDPTHACADSAAMPRTARSLAADPPWTGCYRPQ